MDERGIIIADKDVEYRNQMAEYFERSGYSVETTDSAIHVLCSILEKRTPVLLLGSDFDKKISSADLIHLLKKCNRHLHVIVVSDDLPIAQARQLRQEGIFYHALKPAAGETAEIGEAVACAFAKEEAAAEAESPKEQSRQPEAAPQEAVQVQPVRSRAKMVTAIGCLVALIAGTSYLSLLTAESVKSGKHTAIWLFLVFCASIIATQLLPVFGIKWPVNGREEDPAKQDGVSLDKK